MGFFQCAMEDEYLLFQRLCEYLRAQEPLRCSSVQVAIDRLRGLGLEAKSVVVSEEDATVMLVLTEPLSGCFAGTVNGMKVLVSDLPKGVAVVTVDPTRLGLYTRVSDHLGVLLQRVDRNMMVVDDVAK